MPIKTVTHINLRGQARQALEFYHSIFGGDKAMTTYRQMGNVQDASDADNIVWGQVASDNGFSIMAYDVPSGMPWNQGENAFFISLRGDTAQEVAAYWEKLSDGAKIVQALAPAPWTALYGMLKDKFGIVWVVDVVAPADKI